MRRNKCANCGHQKSKHYLEKECKVVEYDDYLGYETNCPCKKFESKRK